MPSTFFDDTDIGEDIPDFATPGWLDVVQAAFRQCARDAGAAAAAQDFSICEVYENIPAVINAAGRLTWTMRLRAGTVDFVRAETDDVDLKIVGDYYTMHPIAAFVIGGDPDRQREQNRRLGKGLKAGAIRVTGTPDLPACLLPAHDRIAAQTA